LIKPSTWGISLSLNTQNSEIIDFEYLSKVLLPAFILFNISVDTMPIKNDENMQKTAVLEIFIQE